jgi:hypothetical protein
VGGRSLPSFWGRAGRREGFGQPNPQRGLVARCANEALFVALFGRELGAALGQPTPATVGGRTRAGSAHRPAPRDRTLEKGTRQDGLPCAGMRGGGRRSRPPGRLTPCRGLRCDAPRLHGTNKVSGPRRARRTQLPCETFGKPRKCPGLSCGLLATRGCGAGWWARQDSNLRPDRYERPALTAELRAHGWSIARALPPRQPTGSVAKFRPAARSRWVIFRHGLGQGPRAQLGVGQGDGLIGRGQGRHRHADPGRGHTVERVQRLGRGRGADSITRHLGRTECWRPTP